MSSKIKNVFLDYLEAEQQKEELAIQIDTQAEAKVNARLSVEEKQNLFNNKTLDGNKLYYEGNPPTAEEIGAETPAGAQQKANAAKSDAINSSQEAIDARLNEEEKYNLEMGMTLDGRDTFYHSGNKPTKGDVGLSNVENKTSATIRNEITKSNITSTGLSADDVGARSDSWTPSLSDIPAIPTSKVTGLDATLSDLNNRLTSVEEAQNQGSSES